MQKSILLSLLFVLLYNLFFFKVTLGIGFALLLLLVLVFAFLTRNPKNKRFTLAHIFGLVALIFALLQVYRANEFVRFFDTILALYFTSAAWFFYKSEQAFSYYVSSFILIPLANVFQPIGHLINLTEEKDRRIMASKMPASLTAAISRGLVITVPVFLTLLFLLIQADPIFEKRVIDALAQIGERTIISTIIFTGSLLGAFVTTKEYLLEKAKTISANPHRLYELLIIAGSVALLFGGFILIEFPYLFANVSEQELHKIGIASLTYSEYVRKGFFELLIAATIVLGLLAYLLRYVHHMVIKERQLVQSLGSIVIAETAVLLFSAGKRDAMYQLEHGLTQARIVGILFLIMLACFLLLFLIALYKKQQQKTIFLSLLIPVLLFFLSINVVPVDRLIATTYPPTVNKEIDYAYLANLSPDGYQGWLPAIQHAKRVIAQIQGIKKLSDEDYRKSSDANYSLYLLKSQVDFLQKKYGSKKMHDFRLFATAAADHWQSYNRSEEKAYQFITKHKEFGEIDGIIKTIRTIQDKDAQQTTSQQPTPVQLQSEIQN